MSAPYTASISTAFNTSKLFQQSVDAIRPQLRRVNALSRDLKNYLSQGEGASQLWCFMPNFFTDPLLYYNATGQLTRADQPLESQKDRLQNFDPKHVQLTSCELGDRLACIDALCNVYLSDRLTQHHPGVLITDHSPSLELIKTTLEAKLELFESISNVNRQINAQFRVANGQSQAIGWRSSELSQILEALGIANIDLKRLKSNQQFLEPGVSKLGFTWAKTHHRRQRLSVTKLWELQQSLNDSGNADQQRYAQVLKMVLDRCIGGESFVKVSEPRAFLRANVVWKNTDSTEVSRTSVLANQLLIVCQSCNHLPNIIWREKPTTAVLEAAQQQWRQGLEARYQSILPKLGIYLDG